MNIEIENMSKFYSLILEDTLRYQCLRYQELTAESVLRVAAQNYNKTLAHRHIHKT